MTTPDTSNIEKGLPIGTEAPIIDTFDVFENKIILTELYKNYRGIFLDFSRGAW